MKKNLLIDAVALVMYMVVANPPLTGIDIHEWLGIGVFLVLFVHFVTHGEWMVESLRKSIKPPTFARLGNLILDIFALVALLVVIVSGFGVSGAVLPFFGLYMDGYYFWDPLHLISAKFFLAIVVVHLVVHWKWFIGFFMKSAEDNRDG